MAKKQSPVQQPAKPAAPPPQKKNPPPPPKQASGKPAPSKPKPAPAGTKSTPKPVQNTGTAAKPMEQPQSGATKKPQLPVRPAPSFVDKKEARKPLTPINVRLTLDELGNPVYRRIKQRIEQQPGQVESALRSSRSPDAAFRKIFGTWGRNPEMEAKAIEAAKRNGLFSDLEKRNEELEWQAYVNYQMMQRTQGKFSASSGISLLLAQVGIDPDYANRPQELIQLMASEYQNEYLAAAQHRYQELVQRVFTMAGADYENASPGRIRGLLNSYGLPTSYQEFAAQMFASSATVNMLTWATGRSSGTKTTIEGATLFADGLLGIATLGGATFDISAGPLELQQDQYVRLLMGLRPSQDEDALALNSEVPFMNPIPDRAVEAALARSPLTSLYLESTFGNRYASTTSVADLFLSGLSAINIGGAGIETQPRLVDDGQLLAELTAARHLSFLSLYVENVRNDNIETDSYYYGRPDLYALAQTAGGYVDVAPNTRRPLEYLDRIVTNGWHYGYRNWLEYTSGLYGVDYQPPEWIGQIESSR